MRKRILSLILVFVLICTMSISASAATVTRHGVTSNGIYTGVDARGELSVYTDHSYAVTWCEVDSFVKSTEVHFIFTKLNGEPGKFFGSGRTVASAYNSSGETAINNIRGASLHKVDGGENWGTWGYSLATNL